MQDYQQLPWPFELSFHKLCQCRQIIHDWENLISSGPPQKSQVNNVYCESNCLLR